MKKLTGFLGMLLRILLTLLLIIFLCGAVLSAPVCRALTDCAMHEAIATSPETLAAQEAAIADGMEKLTGKYSFAAETLAQLPDRETLAQMNRNAVAWWMNLLQSKDEMTPPAWTVPDLTACLEQDERWQAETKTAKKDIKKLSKAVGALVNGIVLPLRTQLITFAASEAWNRVDLASLTAWLPYVPTVMVLLCLLLGGLICLTRRGVSYVGAACVTAFLLQGLLLIIALRYELLGIVASVSPVLALQAGMLLQRLAPFFFAGLGIELLLGIVLTIRGAYLKEGTV